MTELDDAMLLQMKHLVLEEGRSFSYIDFLSFEIEGKNYIMKHGTFRNKISKLRKLGIVELDCRSVPSFYTLNGHTSGKPVTTNHTMVNVVTKNHPVYKMIQNLPFGNQSIHNIRLKFRAPNIWNTLKGSPNLEKNERSKDIFFPAYTKDSVVIRVIIHKTDTVSVIMGCSLQPITLDHDGTIRLHTLLTRMEEKIRAYVNRYCLLDNKELLVIPDYKKWTVTMWHFGKDALTEYTGEKFSITIEETQALLTRVYSKDMKNGKKVRIESQEYPQEVLLEAIKNKINC